MADFELQPGQLDGATHEVHGIRYVRSGSCHHCTSYEVPPCCTGCPHVKRTKTSHCGIENKLGEVCRSCSELEGHNVGHPGCVGFPQHPWLTVVREGICGYTFAPTNPADAAKQATLDSVWSIEAK